MINLNAATATQFPGSEFGRVHEEIVLLLFMFVEVAKLEWV